MANRFDETRGSERERDFDRERNRDERTLVSRDFQSNEPRYRGYGEMSESWNEPSRMERMGRDDIRGARQLDRGESRGYGRGGGFGERGGAYASQDMRSGPDRMSGQNRWEEGGYGRGEDLGRSRFDESIAGRPADFYGRGPEGGGQNIWNSQVRERDFGREHEGSERSVWAPSSSAYGAGYGRYTGRGPKGYKRSDDRIHEDVCEALTRHPEIDASDIEVRVNNGEVTLSGNVEERRQKRMAEDAIENLPGVRDVNNQVRVKRGLMERVFGTGEEEEKEDTRTRKGSRRAA